MDQDRVIVVLNELLGAELHGLPRRLLESTVFVSSLSIREYGLVQQMAKASEEHASWLADAILARGGVPGPRRVDPRTADLHFVELHHACPQLVIECESLIREYDRALGRIGTDRDSSKLIARILDRHREELSALKEVCGQGMGVTS